MEPIKVTIPTHVALILEKDAELFNIIQPSGTINKNKIYNIIIKNYQNMFIKQHEQSILDITSMFDKSNLQNQDELIHKLTKYMEEKQMLEEDISKTTVIRVQVNKGILGIYEEFIDHFITAYSSVSECLRRLFCSYASKPLNVREQIIFKESVDSIKKAIKDQKQIKFKHRGIKKIVHPYALVTSKEELYNYLLCKEIIPHQQEGRLMSFRLTHIRDVFIQDALVDFSKEDIHCLESTKLLGPQYIVKTKEPQVKVLLNDEGMKQLERIYTHRPTCIKKEDHIYTFACTEEQAKIYFSKFKKNAVVIEPKSLSEKIQKDFYEAQKTYKMYLKDDIESCKKYMNIPTTNK